MATGLGLNNRLIVQLKQAPTHYSISTPNTFFFSVFFPVCHFVNKEQIAQVNMQDSFIFFNPHYKKASPVTRTSLQMHKV